MPPRTLTSSPVVISRMAINSCAAVLAVRASSALYPTRLIWKLETAKSSSATTDAAAMTPSRLVSLRAKSSTKVKKTKGRPT